MKKEMFCYKNKRGQQTMGLPFGLIFSIFLVIIFIVVAFIAINQFLGIGRTSSVGMFYQELQEKIDNSWRGQSSEYKFKIDLPEKITKICFANLSAPITSQEDYGPLKNYYIYDANLFLVPPEYSENMPYKLMNNINITKITQTRNPYCVETSQELIIKKGFYDRLVVIE